MTRLFVAIAIPEALGYALAEARPEGRPGIRNIGVADMHITLHFLGRQRTDEIAAVLQTVAASAPRVRVEGRGLFRMRDGRTILWAGVPVDRRLTALYDAVGDVLTGVGFVAETRPWRPHVTLCRAARRVPENDLEAWVEAGRDETFGCFRPARFALYDAAPSGSDDRYVQVASFPLAPDSNDDISV